MASKRAAASDLNHDNWDNEDESEDAGTFAKAPEAVLEKRVVKTARRRLQNSGDGAPKSAFGSFTGFKTTPAATTSSPFSFLANLKPNTNTVTPPNSNPVLSKTSTSNGSAVPENGLGTVPKSSPKQSTPKEETSEKSDTISDEKSSEYCAKLKGLNESVAQWIKKHVDSNPFCILTPIFRDYEKHLKTIEEKHGQEEKKEGASQKKPAPEDVKVTPSNSEKKIDTSIFGNASAGTSSAWKPEKSIFGNTSNTKSIFSTEPKTESRSLFAGLAQEKNPFLNKPTIEEKQDDKADSKSAQAPFPTATFSFGQGSSSPPANAGFSFGSAKPFSFGAQVAKPEGTDEKAGAEEKDEDDEPPKPEFKPVTEEGSIFEQRCKVFVKKDGNFGDRGVGTLFLKPTPNEKMQLIVRAGNSLGNILLNTLLSESIPLKRMNKNTVMMVCVPTPDSNPPPTSVLLRVKTSEDADTLMEALEKNRK